MPLEFNDSPREVKFDEFELSNEKINLLIQSLPTTYFDREFVEYRPKGQVEDLRAWISGLSEEAQLRIFGDLFLNEILSILDDFFDEYLEELLDDNQEIFNSMKIEECLFDVIRDNALVPSATKVFKHFLAQPKFQKKSGNTRSLYDNTDKFRNILMDGKVLQYHHTILIDFIEPIIKGTYLEHILAENPAKEGFPDLAEHKTFFDFLLKDLQKNRIFYPESILKRILRDTSIYRINILFEEMSEEEMDTMDSGKLLKTLIEDRFSTLLEHVSEALKEKHESLKEQITQRDFAPFSHILAPVWDQLGFKSHNLILMKEIWGEKWHNTYCYYMKHLFDNFGQVHVNEKRKKKQQGLNEVELNVLLNNLQEIELENPLKEIENRDQIMLTYEADDWRKIEGDWLMEAEALALKLDSDTNNTSLVLAIELIESGKVLLFPGDAQAGNWISWKDVKFTIDDGEEKTITAHDLLKRTVFYKVGHHGSHNATLKTAFPKENPEERFDKDVGLEVMAAESKDLIAMIPVEKGMAGKHKWKMPFSDLYDRLKQKTGYRIIRADDGVLDIPSDLSPRMKKQWEEFKSTVVDWHALPDDEKGDFAEAEHFPGYFEITIE